ncbi:MAG: hypothetical protein RLZZ399_1371 [Verrucomicrobiota bacterium]
MKVPSSFAARFRKFGLLFAAAQAPWTCWAEVEGAPDFNREVRPILSRYCFKCHGPDDKSRKGELRLDSREEAMRPAKSGARALVPGDLKASELLARILTHESDEVMPPPSTKTQLTPEQKSVLLRWVSRGAPYAPHWAFVPPKQSTLPEGKEENPIDRFVRARLRREGIAPSPAADRYTLLRRVSYDLTGLPPSAEEAERFAKDPSPGAYAEAVDRLLASPAYGERWARKWLDLARYADTNGYEKDRPRSIWPYRDWVIGALNADMPFDQFTIEQIAGDMLPNASPSQVIATGFHRNTMLNEEGGIDPLEFRFHALTDRVATTGKTWLGLTTGCAQCHTHKFDPITHQEYFQMLAFFNNADEPEYLVKPPDYEQQRQKTEAAIVQKTDALASRFKPSGSPDSAAAPAKETSSERPVDKAFQRWVEKERTQAKHWTVLRPSSLKSTLPFLTVLEDHSVLASGDQGKANTYTLTYPTQAKAIRAIRLDALPDERLPGGGPGLAYYEGPKGDFALTDFKVSVGGKVQRFSGASHSFAAKNMSAAAAIDDNLQSGWGTNGGQGKAHSAIFLLAEPIEGPGALEIQLHFERHYSAALGRFRISVTEDDGEIVARNLSLETDRLLLVSEAERGPEQKQALFREFLLKTPELEAERGEIERLQKSLKAMPTTLVMSERPAKFPRPTFLHNRGEFLQPGVQVQPGVFSFLNPLPAAGKPDRLSFARWLVSRENPLTARVTVNRSWSAFFGRGLVKTVDDFGYQGESPTHPELLDWLAVDFMEKGWSMKKLHRLIVTSETYRQSSAWKVGPDGSTPVDPQNLLLSRGPRVRLEAEMIRDGILQVAGLLHPKLGGPSVYPPQPNGVTETAYGGAKWNVSQGADRYRRSLYTFSKRTAPFAMFTTFDAPVGDVCIAQREVSDTPLQALTLLNDVTIVEATQSVGRRMAQAPGSVEARIEQLFRSCFSRPPAPEEAASLLGFFERQKQRAESRELDAAALAGEGQGDLNERAAWTALARALFNLDEAVTKS